MSGTNVGSRNQGGIQGNPTGRTSTGMVTNLPFLPYMAGLSLPDFGLIIDDALVHGPNFPAMPTKLPSNIPNFEVSPREYPPNHVHSFHM